eukprot:7400951-Ditylum_brightwellii.AAC.1
MSQALQDIVKCTETVKNEYKKDKASLQELVETTSAIQNDTTVQDNLALFHEQTASISQKTDELEAWKKQFNAEQEQCYKESEKKMKKRFEKQEERIDEKFKDISATMEKNQESFDCIPESKEGQIDSLSKCQKADDNPSEGVKCARKELNDLEYNKYMDELDEKIIETQPAGTPLQREAPAPSAKCRCAGQSTD